MESGHDTASGDGEFGVDGEQFGPRQIHGTVEEGIEVGGWEFTDADQESVGGAEPEVAASDVAFVALEVNAAIDGAEHGVTELLKFSGGDGFEAECGGGDEVKTGH